MVVIGSLVWTPARSDWCRQPVDWLPTSCASPGWPNAKWPRKPGPIGTPELAFTTQAGPTDAVEARAPPRIRVGYKGFLLNRVTACRSLFSIHRTTLVLALAPSTIASHAAPPRCTLPPPSDLPSPFPLPLTVGYSSLASPPSPTFSQSSLWFCDSFVVRAASLLFVLACSWGSSDLVWLVVVDEIVQILCDYA
jgi:hypothetical protein